MTRTLGYGVVAAFRERLRGRVVSPLDAGYDKGGESGTDGLIAGLLLLRSVRMTARL